MKVSRKSRVIVDLRREFLTLESGNTDCDEGWVW